jgi:hypothetical protein
MSFVQPDPLPRRQKVVAVTAVILMVPVVLDAFRIVDLGAFRMTPFFLLLACVPFTWASRMPGERPPSLRTAETATDRT